MKKIYLAALTLAMTACVSNDDLNPVDNYGYIDVNVSNDPVMVTRAEGDPEVENLNAWTIIATNSTGANVEYDKTNKYIKVNEGSYTIKASNYSNAGQALLANEGLGDAYYEGSATCEVSPGSTTSVKIECGQAKNSRIKLLSTLDDAFSNVKLNVIGERQKSLNINDVMYFNIGEGGTQISYNITYTHNLAGNVTLPATNSASNYFTLRLDNPAYEYQIRLSSNSNGIIYVTVTWNTSFTESISQTIQFDAATGEKVETPIQGN